MPAITPEERAELDPSLRLIIKDLHDAGFTPGQMDYAFCVIADAFVNEHGMRWTHLKDVQAVFSGALDEFNARVMQPYEASAYERNGIVWTCIEPKPGPITDEQLEELTLRDGHGNSWIKCIDEPDCALEIQGPGRVFCAHCAPEEGEIE